MIHSSKPHRLSPPGIPRTYKVSSCQVRILLSLLAGLMLPVTSSLADVYISNLGNTPSYSTGTDYLEWNGASFTTDGSAYSLNSISILIAPLDDIPANALNGVLYLADSNGFPVSAALLTFSHSAVILDPEPPEYLTLTFTPTAGFELAANSTYMFALTPTNPLVSTGWAVSLVSQGSTTEVPGSSWSIYPSFFTYYDDQWNSDGAPDLWRMIGVNATAIPEPSTYVLLGIALALGTNILRRKRLHS